MKTVGLFVDPPGTAVTLKISAVSNDVITYVVFVQGWTRAGKTPIATWHSGDLEASGRTLLLEPIRGYDLILKGAVRADAELTATLEFDGTAEPAQVLQLPETEGPVVTREWSIVVR